MKIPKVITEWMPRTVLLAGLWLLTGCYLTSVHPIANPDQRTFDRALIGTWASGPDSLRITGDDVDNMELAVIEGRGPLYDSTRSGSLDILATTIHGHHFLDVRPGEIPNSRIPIFEQTLLVPMHAIIRYRTSGDSLILQYLSYQEFDRRGRKGSAFGLDLERVTDDGPLLITSNTAQLRHFLTKHGGDEALFDEPTVYLRQNERRP